MPLPDGDVAAYEPPLHPEPAEIRLAAVLRAVADPTRLKMIRKLAAAEPRELACPEFGCTTKQLASHHLKALREAGVTCTRDEGRQRLSRLRRETLDELFPGLLDGIVRGAETEDSRLS